MRIKFRHTCFVIAAAVILVGALLWINDRFGTPDATSASIASWIVSAINEKGDGHLQASWKSVGQTIVIEVVKTDGEASSVDQFGSFGMVTRLRFAQVDVMRD